MTSDAVSAAWLAADDRPESPSLVEAAVREALEVADRTIGEYDPSRTDPAHDALRAACFSAVLADLLARSRT
jgi:hypothetical protein